MPFPTQLHAAAEAVDKARRAADTLASPLSDDLQRAEYILREVAHFARTVADDNAGRATPAAGRLLSAILGVQFEVLGVRAGYTELRGYVAHARYLDGQEG